MAQFKGPPMQHNIEKNKDIEHLREIIRINRVNKEAIERKITSLYKQIEKLQNKCDHITIWSLFPFCLRCDKSVEDIMEDFQLVEWIPRDG